MVVSFSSSVSDGRELPMHCAGFPLPSAARLYAGAGLLHLEACHSCGKELLQPDSEHPFPAPSLIQTLPGYAIEKVLLISAQLSTDAFSALRTLRVLIIRPWR